MVGEDRLEVLQSGAEVPLTLAVGAARAVIGGHQHHGLCAAEGGIVGEINCFPCPRGRPVKLKEYG